MTSYGKQRSLTGKDYVVWRTLDKETSRLILSLVTIVRPFSAALVCGKHGSEAAERYKTYLFADTSGKVWDGAYIIEVINRWLSDSAMKINFSQLRHFQAAMVDRLTSTDNRRVLLQSNGTDEDAVCALSDNKQNVEDD